MGLAPKPAGGGFETITLSETGFVDPSNGGKMRFSRFRTCAGPPWQFPQKLSNFSFPTRSSSVSGGSRLGRCAPRSIAADSARTFADEKM